MADEENGNENTESTESTENSQSTEQTGEPENKQEVSKTKTLVGVSQDSETEQSKNDDSADAENSNESEDEKKDSDSEEAEGAPEEYEEFQFSEGFEANKELLGKFAAQAKEDNLSQEKAQKYTAMAEEAVKDAYSDAYKKQYEAWTETMDGWVEEIKSDPEIGGKDLEKNLAGCNSVLNQFADKEFREELTTSGFGNNAGLVRMLHRINKATQNDKFIKGSETKSKKTPEEIWYGEK